MTEFKSEILGTPPEKPDYLAVYLAAWYGYQAEKYDQRVCPPEGLPKRPGDLAKINRNARNLIDRIEKRLGIHRSWWYPYYKKIEYMDLEGLLMQQDMAWREMAGEDKALIVRLTSRR